MNCMSCGFEVERGFAFCPKCGTPQQKVCPSCEYACPPDFAFCPQCGTALSAPREDAAPQPRSSTPERFRQPTPVKSEKQPPPPTPEAEADRRIVTALFADLCGYTTLGEQIDPETLQTLQNEIFEELSAAVAANGGYVDKFIGDALLALFGAPVAHEKDPERALCAALDMQRRMAVVEEHWRGHLGQPLTLHIGVNTGPVVTGAVGVGKSKSYSVTGDTVNTAQRLQAMAGPGAILVGRVTHRLTQHAFSFASLGTLPLRGKADQTTVYQLVEPISSASTARGLGAYGIDIAMIGRDGELASLLRCLDFVNAGATQLVRIVGDAGIGKTRLVEAFLDRVRANEDFSDITIRQTACSSLGEASYGTLAATLRCAYQIDPSDNLERSRSSLVSGLTKLGLPSDEIERLKPYLLFALGFGDPDDELKHLEPDQLRRQIFHAVRTLFDRRMEQSPLLLVIEDLHWADEVSLEALRFIMDRVERSRLMLLVTHRPGFETEVLSSARASQTTIRLSPLAAAETLTILDAAFGSGSIPQRLETRIVERGEGNPFFVEEILRALIEVGVLRHDGNRWQTTETAEDAETPLGVQAMMLARIDRLTPEARRLAQVASVIGHRFDRSLLVALPGGDADIDANLSRLCDADIIEEVGDIRAQSAQRYAFRQRLLHQVVYDNLLLRRRTELHGAIGVALEKKYGTSPEHLEQLIELGHHFSASADKAKGVTYLMAAGDFARKAYANEDALRFYSRALAAAEAAGGDLWRRPTERIADLSLPTEKRTQAREAYERLLATYRQDDDVPGAARILRKLGQLAFDSGERKLAASCFAEATNMLEGVHAPIELAHLLQQQGHLAFRAGDYAIAVRWADRALECANHLTVASTARSDVALVISRAFNTKGVALARMHRLPEAVQMVERSVEIALGSDHFNTACRGYTNLGVLYTSTNPALAIEVCRRGYDMAMQIGDLGQQARLLTNLAVAYCTFTDRCMHEGLPAVEKAIAIDRALGLRDHLPVALLVLGQIRQCHGATDAAHQNYLEVLDLVRDSAEAQLLFPCYDGLATLSLDMDNLEEAERYFDLAQRVCAEHDLDPEALIVLPFLD